MSDSKETESPKRTGKLKRLNKSPLTPEATEENVSNRQKRLKTREVRTLNAIMEKKFDDFVTTFNQTKETSDTKLNTLITKLDQTDSKIDSLITDVSLIKEKTASLEATQKDFRQEIDLMKAELKTMSFELGSVQQATLSHHFIMFGLPHEIPKEKAFESLRKFAQHVGVTIKEQDLKHIALRKNEKQKTAFLVGIFHDGRIRQQLFEGAKNNRPITVESVFPSLPANSRMRGREMTLKEQTAPSVRRLLDEAQRMNHGRFKYIWARNGRILLKEKDGDNETILAAQTIDQLGQIFVTFNSRRHSSANMSTSSAN